MHDLLLKLGLSDKEAAVYLAILELAEDTALNISEKSKVNRATTYVAIEALKKLGLVSSIERGKKTYFVAEDPSELENLLKRQLDELEHRREQLQRDMSQFRAIHNRDGKRPIVRMYEGAEGLEALDRMGRDALGASPVVYSIIPVGMVERLFSNQRKSAVQSRVKERIRSKTIYTRPEPFTEEENKSALREAIYLPEKALNLNGSILIFPGWGVKFFSFEEGSQFGVLIQSKEVAQNMLQIYQLAEEGAKARAAIE